MFPPDKFSRLDCTGCHKTIYVRHGPLALFGADDWEYRAHTQGFREDPYNGWQCEDCRLMLKEVPDENKAAKG